MEFLIFLITLLRTITLLMKHPILNIASILMFVFYYCINNNDFTKRQLVAQFGSRSILFELSIAILIIIFTVNLYSFLALKKSTQKWISLPFVIIAVIGLYAFLFRSPLLI